MATAWRGVEQDFCADKSRTWQTLKLPNSWNLPSSFPPYRAGAAVTCRPRAVRPTDRPTDLHFICAHLALAAAAAVQVTKRRGFARHYSGEKNRSSSFQYREQQLFGNPKGATRRCRERERESGDEDGLTMTRAHVARVRPERSVGVFSLLPVVVVVVVVVAAASVDASYS